MRGPTNAGEGYVALRWTDRRTRLYRGRALARGAFRGLVDRPAPRAGPLQAVVPIRRFAHARSVTLSLASRRTSAADRHRWERARPRSRWPSPGPSSRRLGESRGPSAPRVVDGLAIPSLAGGPARTEGTGVDVRARSVVLHCRTRRGVAIRYRRNVDHTASSSAAALCPPWAPCPAKARKRLAGRRLAYARWPAVSGPGVIVVAEDDPQKTTPTRIFLERGSPGGSNLDRRATAGCSRPHESPDASGIRSSP